MQQITHRNTYARILTLGVSALLFASCLFSVGHAESIAELIKNSNMEIKQVAGVDITFPSRAKPDAKQEITDLNYWLETLPHEQDKNNAGYVVYPKIGMITPLVRPDDNDISKIKIGDVFDHYKYLEEGALHYVGKGPDEGVGNMVLAVHSSFAKNDPGRYKTAGQVAPLSKLGDKVFVYLADNSGTYTLYIYTIQRSEEIPESQVNILDQTVSKKTLTLFTCYPIGTTDARWVNQAVLTETLTADKRTKPQTSPTFTTQAVTTKKVTTLAAKTTTKETTPTHGSAPEEKPELSKKKSIKPTFRERVSYRPVVYRAAINLVTKVGFKRTNLQKLLELIDQKIVQLTPEDLDTITEKNKKRVVAFMLIKEIIEVFLQ
jgi:sortase (surface protein transpeptidase)